MALPRLCKDTSISSACSASDFCDRFALFNYVPPHLLRLSWQCYKLEMSVLTAWRWGYHSCYQPYLLQPSVVFTVPMSPPSIFPLHPRDAPLQHLASCRRRCDSPTTFIMKERSPAHSLTFLKYSVLFVGVLRSGPENVNPLVLVCLSFDVFNFCFSL